jgi:hypothetical protein
MQMKMLNNVLKKVSSFAQGVGVQWNTLWSWHIGKGV